MRELQLESVFMEFLVHFYFQASHVFLLPASLLAVCLAGLVTFFCGDAVRLSIGENLRLDTADCCVQNGLLQLTFPHDDDAPALGFQLPTILLDIGVCQCRMENSIMYLWKIEYILSAEVRMNSNTSVLSFISKV